MILSNNTTEQAKRNTEESIVAEIVLGNPRMECRKFGICAIHSMEDKATPSTLAPRKSIALIQLKAHSIVFRFQVDSMTPRTRKSFFGLNKFVIDSPVHLCQSLFSSLEKNSKIIPIGHYDVYKTSAFYKVVFPIQLNEDEILEVKKMQICRS